MADTPSRPKGKTLRSGEKAVAFNVFQFFRQENPDMTIQEVVNLTAKATKISECSIFRLRKEHSTTAKFVTPSKKKSNRRGKVTQADKYDEFTTSAIRFKVHDFFRCNEVPTLNKVMMAVNDDDQLPNFKRDTLSRLLKDMKFKFSKRIRNAALTERHDIIAGGIDTYAKSSYTDRLIGVFIILMRLG